MRKLTNLIDCISYNIHHDMKQHHISDPETKVSNSSTLAKNDMSMGESKNDEIFDIISYADMFLQARTKYIYF